MQIVKGKRRIKKYRKRRTRKKRGGNKIIPPIDVGNLEQILVNGGVSQDKIAKWPKTLDKLLEEMRNG